MSGVVEWLPKVSSEEVYRYADFTDELAMGDALASATVAITVYSGNDSNPQNVFFGAARLPNTAGINAVLQVTLGGGVVGTIYQCVMSGVTNAGLTITKTASLAIKPPLN